MLIFIYLCFSPIPDPKIQLMQCEKASPNCSHTNSSNVRLWNSFLWCHDIFKFGLHVRNGNSALGKFSLRSVYKWCSDLLAFLILRNSYRVFTLCNPGLIDVKMPKLENFFFFGKSSPSGTWACRCEMDSYWILNLITHFSFFQKLLVYISDYNLKQCYINHLKYI